MLVGEKTNSRELGLLEYNGLQLLLLGCPGHYATRDIFFESYLPICILYYDGLLLRSLPPRVLQSHCCKMWWGMYYWIRRWEAWWGRKMVGVWRGLSNALGGLSVTAVVPLRSVARVWVSELLLKDLLTRLFACLSFFILLRLFYLFSWLFSLIASVSIMFTFIE